MIKLFLIRNLFLPISAQNQTNLFGHVCRKLSISDGILTCFAAAQLKICCRRYSEIDCNILLKESCNCGFDGDFVSKENCGFDDNILLKDNYGINYNILSNNFPEYIFIL